CPGVVVPGRMRATPSLPCARLGNRSQPTATVLACFGGFPCRRFASDCHRLQPRGSIKAPSFVFGLGDTAGARAVVPNSIYSQVSEDLADPVPRVLSELGIRSL